MRIYNHVSIIAVALLMTSCTTSTTHFLRTKRYQDFCKEIESDLVQEFEEYLPLPYESSVMAKMRHVPYYSAFGLFGIDVLYQLDSAMFAENMNKLMEANMTPLRLFEDSTAFDKSNSGYYSVMFNKTKIAFPRIEDDFCQDGDSCMTWTDLRVVVLEIGTIKAFPEDINPASKPQTPTNNYSIGALYSQIERDIIYWLFIYE